LTVLWATAAFVLPWVVRGRSLAADAVAATAWAAALAAATTALAGALALPEPRAVVLGAVTAAALALAPTHARIPRAPEAAAGEP
jgi:hypothetical protein